MSADSPTHAFIERWKQHLRQLRKDWYSNSRETRTSVAKNVEYCFVVRSEPVAGKPGSRKLTEEPTFCAPNEDPIAIGPLNSTNLPQAPSARKCPACPAPEPPRLSSGDDNSTILIKLLQEKVQRVENENTRLKEEKELLYNEYKNVCGDGEEPLNHTMRALVGKDVRDARMNSYNHWVDRVCNLRVITGEHLAQQLEQKYPEYYKLVNTFADFDVRLCAMREDLADLNLHQSEKLVEGLAREKLWFGSIGPVKGGDYTFELGYRFMKNKPSPEPEETRPRKSARRN